jgi:hypothetical protein
MASALSPGVETGSRAGSTDSSRNAPASADASSSGAGAESVSGSSPVTSPAPSSGSSPVPPLPPADASGIARALGGHGASTGKSLPAQAEAVPPLLVSSGMPSAAEMQAKAAAGPPPSEQNAPGDAKKSDGADAGKNTISSADKKKGNAEAGAKVDIPAASPLGALAAAVAGGVAVIAGLPATAPAVVVTGVDAKSAGSALATSSPGSSAAQRMAASGATVLPKAGGEALQGAGRAAGELAATAAAKAGSVLPGSTAAGHGIDLQASPASVAAGQQEDAGRASGTGSQGKGLLPASPSASLGGPGVTVAGSGAAVSGAPAHDGKSTGKPAGTVGFLSSLTASGSMTSALHPGTVAASSSPQAAVSSGGGMQAAAANPYARLDEASAPALLHASPRQMTVAVQDATLGSLQVQVQSVNGQLAASLATATTAAHAQLSGHVASLSGYLHDQHIDVARVTVAAPDFSSLAGQGHGSSAHDGGNSGQPPPQSFSPPASASPSEPPPVVFAGSAASSTSVPGVAISHASSIDVHA